MADTAIVMTILGRRGLVEPEVSTTNGTSSSLDQAPENGRRSFDAMCDTSTSHLGVELHTLRMTRRDPPRRCRGLKASHSEELAERWARKWPFVPSWQEMACYAQDIKFGEDHPPALGDGRSLRMESCHEIWQTLATPGSRPPLQAVISYRLVYEISDSAPARLLDPGQWPDFHGELWHSQPFGARFAQPAIGWQHWYIATGRFGWNRLRPLIETAIERVPINSRGGVLISAYDFSWVWHPYERGSLIARSEEMRS